jgi:hypothetical protein
VLLQLAPQRDVPLLMPQLGQPLEPARVEVVDPWWRPIAALEARSAPKLLTRVEST